MKIDSFKQVDTIILGAGISGLTLAHYLNKKNLDFLVVESQPKVGGNIISFEKSGFVCENGPNTVLLNKKSVVELIDEIGLKDKIIFPNDYNNKRFLLRKGKLIPIPQNFIEFIKTNLLSLTSKLRLIIEIFIPKHNRNVSVKSFFKKRFGNNFEEIFVEPFLTGIYAGETNKMSTKHVLNKIWNMEQKSGSIIIDTLKRKKKLNKSRSFNFKNGLIDFVLAINKNISNKMILKSEVTSVKKIKKGYEIIINNNIKYHCKKLISTLPAFGLANIIFDEKISKNLKKINYCPIMVLHLGIEKSKIKENIDGFGVLTKRKDNQSFLGILFNSRIFPHVAPQGNDLLTVIIGGARQPQLIDQDVNKLKKTIINEIRKIISYDGKIIMENNFLWKNGIPQYDLDHDVLIENISDFHKKNKNFYILGNYIKGISVSDCIQNAFELSKKL